MRSFLILPLAAVALGFVDAHPAFAEDAPAAPTAPPSAFTVTGGATVITDYRFRGLSQTDKTGAIQGTLGVSHSSGLYVGTWGSSIHDYVSAGSNQEIDLYGGYKHSWGGWAFDMGLLYYYYPGHAKGATTDFFEPYLNASHSFGPLGVKVGMNYAWKQHALRCDYDARCGAHVREDNLYTYGELSAAIPKTGITLTGHVGETWGRSYLTNGLKDYTDWSVNASYTWKQLTFGVSYIGTDFKKGEIVSPTGRQLGKSGVVGSIGFAF
jgi:uncharacterized protein (TIGR02001 family)